jgi:uncharacterized protein (DUF342 family)
MGKTKVTSFVNQFLAYVKGDTAQVQAEKVFRQAQSALNVSISSLTGDTVNFEDAITEAEENLLAARINKGLAITDRSVYVSNLLSAKNKLTTAEENLEMHNQKLNFLKETLTALEKEESPIERTEV